MSSIKRLLRRPEFHIFIFCLLFAMFDWPLLAITAQRGLLNLFVYIFALWFALILLLFVVAQSIRSAKDVDKDGGG